MKSHDGDPILARMLAAAGWRVTDTTWGNDACASLTITHAGREALVFVDMAPFEDREGGWETYTVHLGGYERAMEGAGPDCETSDRDAVRECLRRFFG